MFNLINVFVNFTFTPHGLVLYTSLSNYILSEILPNNVRGVKTWHM